MLLRNLDDPGYTPKRRDVRDLLALLEEKDESIASSVERVLLRIDQLDDAAKASFEKASPRARGRICRLLAKHGAATRMAPWLAEVLASDIDAGVRKRAARAIGHAQSEAAEEALVGAWHRETDLPVLRAIAESLGKIGSLRVADDLAKKKVDDPELTRIVAKARLMIDRTTLRSSATSSRIEGARAPSRPLAVRFRCRAGLAPLVASELDAAFAPKIASPSAVDAVLTEPLDRCFMSRCALDFGFVVRAEPIENGDVAGAVVRALVSARSILAELEAPPHRFRISWSEGGHKRGAVWKIAEDARAASPDLVNDPTASAWNVVVREKSHKREDASEVEILLVPSSLSDPRFSYRVADVPAASHPTLAAAIARVAGAHDDDVVWDPFVGSGTELVERAKLGPFVRAFGTDTDERALAAARQNLKAAGVSAGIISGDALSHRAEGVSLVITNPPMGRRVHRGADLHALLDGFLDHAASVLVPGGRIAWISPLPARTAEHAKKLGLRQERGIDVDMGGFSAQIQLLSRPARKSK